MGVLGSKAGVILLTLLAAGCAARGARPAPFPRPAVPASQPDSNESSEARLAPPLALGPDIVDAALALQGAEYAPGASGPDRFDCSGLVQFVFSKFEIALPRTVAEQFAATTPIQREHAAAGDLLFFRISGAKPSHVAIALGDGRFVHAPSTRGVVRVEHVTAPYWNARLQAAHRVMTTYR